MAHVNLSYYRNQILPWFKGKPVSDITRRVVLQWHASLHGVPFAADRSAPILSVIFKQAEAYGYRPEGSNPCTGIKRYRRGGRERFLSAGEMRRLSRVLDRYQDRHPVEASIVRLLLLTGCRKSEILTLRWSEYREGRLCLSDTKTGPRTVWLSSAARKVLNDLPRTGPWVFPSPRGNGPHPKNRFDCFWWKIRTEAVINDVRCHDLRHTYASIAIAHGETVLTIGKLLGHNDPATTLTAARRFPLELVPALPYLRSQPRKPLRRQVADEFRRREGRIAVRLLKGAQHAKRFGGIEIVRPGQKPVGVDRLDIEASEDLGRKVGQVVGDDILCAAADRRRQDVAVVGIRKFERPDQRLVSGDQRLRKMLVHGIALGADAAFKMRLLFEEVQRPLVENPFGPSRPEQSGVVEAQENVPLAERKQDVRIQQGDTTVRELRQDASNS